MGVILGVFSAYKWIVISGTLLTLAVGGYKIYSSIYKKGYDRAFKKIERANEREQTRRTNSANSSANRATNRARDLENCAGKDCVDVVDDLFKKGW